MRNRNAKYSEQEEKERSRIKGQNPFDLRDYVPETVYMKCSSCGQYLTNWPIDVHWAHGIDYIGYEGARVEVERAVHAHKCTKEAEQKKRISEAELMSSRIEIFPQLKKLVRRCSGYGVFPDGSRCPGCDDCKVKTGQHIFNEGMWVINTDTGKTYRLDKNSLAIVIEHYDKGGRNITPYE